ncbi:hypothetical protein L1987_18984 [Smallanthus sonchifolius]|uniref:Uncharacterized protein n=1 Tax=Smallanthus sonchifolius TaxID=185202 RepID=A0ACB9J3T7_9ASTR|nr:hypothetical protein L1987_18984 [Smallanthus sonchifolius]
MSTARSHVNSADNDTEEPSEHSSSSRETSSYRSLSIPLNAEPSIATPATNLRSRPAARRTWPQGMSPPRQTQPQQPLQLPSPRQPPTSLCEVGGPSTPIIGIPIRRLPLGCWERDYLTVEHVRRLHDQGFEHEMRLHHHQNLMDQMISQLSATHIELHQARDQIEDAMWEIRRLRMKVVVRGLVACMASSSDSSADESGYVVARIPFPRVAYVTGREPVRIVDLNLLDHPHDHALGKCPMWLSTESNSEPSTRAPPVLTPQEPTKNYIQLYEYFDWKAEVVESLGWLTAHGTDMKARLDFHTDLATDMSGQINEVEQDLMQNHDKTTTALGDAHAAGI